MRVFLDTEFLELSGGPRFISAGFVSDEGHELYSEVTLAEVESMLEANPNEFARQEVVSQFGRWPGVRWSDLPAALAAWLNELGDGVVELVYDYSHDFLLVEQLLVHDAALSPRLQPAHVGYLLDDPDGRKAAATAWDALEAARGLRRHHALADAYSLRARFEAVHPSTPVRQLNRKVEMLGTVSAVISEFHIVHVESDDGQRIVSVGEDVDGVDWRTLVPGQRLRCVLHLGPTRVLFAEVLEPAFPEEKQSNG